MKILIVDDTKLSRSMIIKRLPKEVKESSSIIEATNGEEAVTLFMEHAPDITFLDLTMPIMSGFDALALIKAHNKEAIIFVVTADIQAKSLERVMAMGATGMEAKPITEKRLSEIFFFLLRDVTMMNDDQKGVLEELINIAFGSATALIASLFDSFATLRVPKIDMVSIGEINEMIRKEGGTNEFFLTSQQIKGSFTGEIVLAVDEESARNMQLVIGEGEAVDESSQLQNILEIANILGSSCMGKFAELLEAEVRFTPPTIDHTDCIIKDLSESPYSMVIIISTVLAFEDLNIQGNMIIMFRNDMYKRLAEALDNFVENI